MTGGRVYEIQLCALCVILVPFVIYYSLTCQLPFHFQGTEGIQVNSVSCLIIIIAVPQVFLFSGDIVM